MKHFALKTILISLAVLTPLASVAGISYAIPNQYKETYVGELEHMFNRLTSIKESKVIVVGGSNVAFGIRSDLIEQELDMPCVNFGLYGTLGTKIMMDLSKANINKGDIVILAPEPSRQPMSLYFNPDAALRAMCGNAEMMSYIPDDNKLEMLNQLPVYLKDNFDIYTGNNTLNLSGIYQQSSFNEYCDIAYERPYNIMNDLYDAVSDVALSTQDGGGLSYEFLDYANEYATYVREKGAEIYFSYSPTDSLSVSASQEQISIYEDFLYDNLNMKVISNLRDYIMDPLLFYDTNFHCNDVGVIYRTNTLINDIKRELGINTPNNIYLPDYPLVPQNNSENKENDNNNEDNIDLNNKDLDCFNYEIDGNTYGVASMTDTGKSKSSLTIPATYNNIAITKILAKAFENNSSMIELHVQSNIVQIRNEAFKGCKKLQSIYIEQTDPTKITVGMAGGLLEGIESTCYIYVPKASLSLYQNDYNWEAYRTYLRGY